MASTSMAFMGMWLSWVVSVVDMSVVGILLKGVDLVDVVRGRGFHGCGSRECACTYFSRELPAGAWLS
jgi:hypothetical protein